MILKHILMKTVQLINLQNCISERQEQLVHEQRMSAMLTTLCSDREGLLIRVETTRLQHLRMCTAPCTRADERR